MPYHSTSHIAQSVGSTIRAISPRCNFLAETCMGQERRFRTTRKILYDRAYRSVRADRAKPAHIIHGGSSQNRAAVFRDRHAEPRKTDAYLNQYDEELKGEPACQQACRSGGSAIAAEALMNTVPFVTRRRRAGRYAAAGLEKLEEYSLEYVEDLGEPRTK
jgi:hypothetical protein